MPVARSPRVTDLDHMGEGDGLDAPARQVGQAGQQQCFGRGQIDAEQGIPEHLHLLGHPARCACILGCRAERERVQRSANAMIATTKIVVAIHTAMSVRLCCMGPHV